MGLFLKGPVGEKSFLSLASKVSDCLRSGGIVILPTETVYGLACSPNCPEAYEKIYALKKRNPQKSLSWHIGSKSQIDFPIESLAFQKLSDCFWPGPLTMVVPHPTLQTLGIRFPSHPVFIEVSQRWNAPLFVSSANISMQGSPHSVESIPESLLNAVDIVVDSGEIMPSIDSTVVDICDEKNPKILRQGAITLEDIDRCLKNKISSKSQCD